MLLLSIALPIAIYFEIKSLFYNFYLSTHWKFHHSAYYAECNTGKVSANLRPLIYNRPSTAREGSKLTILIATDILISTRLVKP